MNVQLLVLIAVSLLIVSKTTNADQTWLTVSGKSMYPFFKSGDKVKLDTFAYAGNVPHKGDYVGALLKGKRQMLKKVVATSGDLVIVNKKSILINGQKIELAPPYPAASVLQIQMANYHNTVPKNTIILLGENQGSSYDSRQLGLISTSQLLGKVIARKRLGDKNEFARPANGLRERIRSPIVIRNSSSRNYILSEQRTISRTATNNVDDRKCHLGSSTLFK